MSTSEKTESAEQQKFRNIRFPNKMIEQIKTTLSKKGPGISARHWSLPSETNVRKESIYIN